MSSERKVYVIGVSLTKFIKPGKEDNSDYPQMAKQAAYRALHDAGIEYKLIQQASCSYVSGDSCCGNFNEKLINYIIRAKSFI